MSAALYQVDAFASAPFTGNPAAVCLLDTPVDEVWMQAVAAEMGHSETAFVVPRADGDHDLRWFTPLAEAELCGHATLASAHVMVETGRIAGLPIRFHTRSGLLTATPRDGNLIELDFPSDPPRPADPPAGVVEALGTTPTGVSHGRIGWVVELIDEPAVRSLEPDVARLARHDSVVVTARAPDGAGYDFVSRYFAPGWGIAEDPVTGSAHCALAPYWAARHGREELVGFQVSARGGVVGVTVAGDRVRLRGSAVTVLRGELLG